MTTSFKRSIFIQYTLCVHAKKCYSANLIQIFCTPSSNSSSQHSQSICWVLRNVKKKKKPKKNLNMQFLHTCIKTVTCNEVQSMSSRYELRHPYTGMKRDQRSLCFTKFPRKEFMLSDHMNTFTPNLRPSLFLSTCLCTVDDERSTSCLLTVRMYVWVEYFLSLPVLTSWQREKNSWE